MPGVELIAGPRSEVAFRPRVRENSSPAPSQLPALHVIHLSRSESHVSTVGAEPTDGNPHADPPPDFAAVVAEHWTAVYRLLYSLTGDPHATDDLAQETFLRALQRYADLRPDSRLRPWLLRIATNACFERGPQGQAGQDWAARPRPAGRRPASRTPAGNGRTL